MGMDPATIALLAGTIGSSAMGSIFAPNGQQLESFHNREGIDPGQMLSEGKGLISDLLGSLIDDANSPTTIHTTVKPLPSFAGGGLPMAIGAPGRDDNQMNPDLRTTPGLNIPKRSLSGGNGSQNRQRDPGDGTGTSTPDPNAPGRVAIPRPQSLTGIPGISDPMTGGQQPQGGDPAAAVDLLIKSLSKNRAA